MDSPFDQDDDIAFSYFDLPIAMSKPISINNNTRHHPVFAENNLNDLDDDQDMDEDNILPDYLQSFSESGISHSRLKRFSWLHPRNYSGDGSLSDADILSPYGTSVSSPRGDEWELVDHGPRKSIDELWDEVFEYRRRIQEIELAHQAASHLDPTIAAASSSEEDAVALWQNNPQRVAVPELDMEGSVCSSLASSFLSFTAGGGGQRREDVGRGQGSLLKAELDRTPVYAKGLCPSKRGSALRLLQMF